MPHSPTMPYSLLPNGIATLTISRPADKNAVLPRTMIEWLNGMKRAESDPGCKVLVVTALDGSERGGSEKGDRNFYCTGIGLQGLNTPIEEITDDHLKAGLEIWKSLIAALISFPKPLVALVNGLAVGFGFTTLSLFDFIYARDNAVFSAPFVKVGVPPGACSTRRFGELIGERKANEILLGGNKVTGKELEGSFVNKCFPSSTPDLLSAAAPILTSLASAPLSALISTKSLLRPAQWKAEMQELNSRECQALLDILLGVEEKGRKKPVKERPVNFVRFFGELGILAIKEADAADAGKGGARL